MDSPVNAPDGKLVNRLARSSRVLSEVKLEKLPVVTVSIVLKARPSHSSADNPEKTPAGRIANLFPLKLSS